MRNPAWSPIMLRTLCVVIVACLPGMISAQSPGTLPVEIVVLPPSGGAQSPGTVPGGGGAGAPESGRDWTITAVFVSAAPGGPDASAALDLLILDWRAGAPGWHVSLRSDVAAGHTPIGFERFLPPDTTRGGIVRHDLTVGQSLDHEMTIVTAALGEGWGTHRVPVALTAPGSQYVLVVGMVTAP